MLRFQQATGVCNSSNKTLLGGQIGMLVRVFATGFQSVCDVWPAFNDEVLSRSGQQR